MFWRKKRRKQDLEERLWAQVAATAETAERERIAHWDEQAETAEKVAPSATDPTRRAPVSEIQTPLVAETPAPASVIQSEDTQREAARLRLEALAREREAARIEQERLEQERLERERLEQERLEQERLEQERLEQERLEKERLEQERLEQERLEKERIEKERIEQERLEQERLENERLEQERLEQERLEKERLEQERLEKERQETKRGSLVRLPLLSKPEKSAEDASGDVIRLPIDAAPEKKEEAPPLRREPITARAPDTADAAATPNVLPPIPAPPAPSKESDASADAEEFLLEDPLRVFGEVVSMLGEDPVYRNVPIADLNWIVAPAINAKQALVARAHADGEAKGNGKAKVAVGAILWANVSDEADQALRQAGGRLENFRALAPDWNGGQKVWIVAITGSMSVQTAMIRHLDQQSGQDKPPAKLSP